MPHNYEHEHDPLCRSHYRRLIPADRCTDCELILRTRSHTLRSVLVELEDTCQRAGWISSPDGSHLLHASDALDAIWRLLDELPNRQVGSGYDPTATDNRP